MNEHLKAGPMAADWDGKDDGGGEVSGWVYFYRLKAGDSVQTRKMVMLK